MYRVLMKKCIRCFSRPQQMNILSWVKLHAKKKKYPDLKIPKGFKKAQVLVGHAPVGRGPQINPDVAMDELEVRAVGPIYPVEGDQEALTEVRLQLKFKFE